MRADINICVQIDIYVQIYVKRMNFCYGGQIFITKKKVNVTASLDFLAQIQNDFLQSV